MAKRPKSFGKKKAEANKQIFVGRTEQLRQFEDNIRIGPGDDFYNIFNIYGQGGVGKTTLAERYQTQKYLNLESEEDMYEHLQNDYKILKLEEKGITPETYNQIIQQLKKKHNQ